MAITRTQIAKQLLKKGGPAGGQTGSKGGYSDNERAERQATRSRDVQRGGRQFDTSTGPISPGTTVKGQFRDDNPFNEGPPSKLNPPPKKITVPPEKPDETEFQKFKRTFNPFPLATSVFNKISNSKLARINNAMQRQRYIDSLDLDDPEEKEEYDRIMNQLGGLGMDIIAGPTDLESTMLSVPPSMLATDPMTQFKKVDGVSTLGNPGVDDVLGTGYDEYLNRFETEDTGGRDDTPMDPCKGPNPPAYCFIGDKADETQEAVVKRNLAGLTPRIGGSIFDFTGMADGGRIGAQEGGIMPRLNQLSGNVSSAEQMLQQINQRLESAESSLGSGGGGFGSGGPLDQGIGPDQLTEAKLEAILPGMRPGNIPGTNAPYSSLRGSLNQFSSGVDTLNVTPPQTPVAMQQPLSGIPAAGYADGGIASLDREAFLLGGLAKGLKKAVRGVKKLVKSPVGKMALGAAIFSGGFGLGGLQRGLFGITAKGQALRGFPELAAKKGLFGKLGLTGGYGSLMPTVEGGITLASILSGLTTKEDKDKFDLDAYYAANQLNPSQSIRGMGSEFNFYGGERMRVADGGRMEYDEAGAVMSKEDMEKIAKSPLYKGFKKMYGVDPSMAKDNPAYDEKFKAFEQLFKKGYQEGGDVEPVAKKTMPLLDMDGKEKDYRETGGFVDMGRMERADDVPARLSKNEFVFTADAVRNAGDGNVDKGAEVMYNMMKNLESGGDVSEESQGLDGAREMFQTSQRLGEVI